MNIRAGLGEYILQTHNRNFLEDSIEPPNPPSGYATDSFPLTLWEGAAEFEWKPKYSHIDWQWLLKFY